MVGRLIRIGIGTAPSAAKDCSHRTEPCPVAVLDRATVAPPAPSISSGFCVTSLRSAGETGLTRKPRWSESLHQPRRRPDAYKASRTAARLRKNCLGEPGDMQLSGRAARRVERMAARSTLLNGRRQASGPSVRRQRIVAKNSTRYCSLRGEFGELTGGPSIENRFFY